MKLSYEKAKLNENLNSLIYVISKALGGSTEENKPTQKFENLSTNFVSLDSPLLEGLSSFKKV